jgi:hypothetical protein
MMVLDNDKVISNLLAHCHLSLFLLLFLLLLLFLHLLPLQSPLLVLQSFFSFNCALIEKQVLIPRSPRFLPLLLPFKPLAVGLRGRLKGSLGQLIIRRGFIDLELGNCCSNHLLLLSKLVQLESLVESISPVVIKVIIDVYGFLTLIKVNFLRA